MTCPLKAATRPKALVVRVDCDLGCLENVLHGVWAEWDRRGVFGGKEEEGGGGLGQERLVRSGQKYSRGISDGLIFVSHLT